MMTSPKRLRTRINYSEPESEDIKKYRSPNVHFDIPTQESLPGLEWMGHYFPDILSDERRSALAAERFYQPQLITCNFHVETMASLNMEQADTLIHGLDENGLIKFIDPARRIVVLITYPLNLYVKLTIKPYGSVFSRKRLTVGYVLWCIAKEYERIYANSAKYGVFGHGLNDLYFERLHIERNSCLLAVGS